MLSTPDLAAILERVTYKAGWRFTVYDGEFEGQHIVITTVLPDADGGEPITLDVHSMLPPMAGPATFMRWLAWRLGRIETHEMREFLRIDGKPVFDPHAANAERDSATYVPSV